MHATISAIEYYQPPDHISTDDLITLFPDVDIVKLDTKLGISKRPIAAADQCASDLAVAAAIKLFESGACAPADIDFLLLCTQSPDYALPTTACLLQHRLNIPTTAGALDYNLGCSGFVYGLGFAEGLIATGQARSVLLITAETYSKYIHPSDLGCRAIFADGAAATLIKSEDCELPLIGPFLYGTNGEGGSDLIAVNSGTRRKSPPPLKGEGVSPSHQGRDPFIPRLLMNGHKVFDFALHIVPQTVKALLRKTGCSIQDIDIFIFHQANRYLLEAIGLSLGIPHERLQITLNDCGNTVSSTIPIALKHAELEGRIKRGDIAMVVGFGVGYSWAATLLKWNPISG